VVKNTQLPDIIFLNGSSSSGKTTLGKAMQDAFTHPYLLFGCDDLFFMSPKRYYGDADSASQSHKDGFTKQGVEMIEVQKPGEPISIHFKYGPVFRRIIFSMAPVVATLVKQGNSVIFDHVLHDQEMYDDCKKCFADFYVLSVGIFCPLAILEQREKQRGDRVLGLARGLFNIVHSFCDYDIDIDTSMTSVEDAVNLVKPKLSDFYL
jgi:chloramphenicol 3-O phosphotransferase